MAALYLDITLETIKPWKPVAVALKMGNEKMSAFKSNFSISLFYYYQVLGFFVCVFFIHPSYQDIFKMFVDIPN